MSVSLYSIISDKEFEKFSKCEDLEIEAAKMRKMKIKIIPVIVGTIVMIKEGTYKYVDEIPNFQS